MFYSHKLNLKLGLRLMKIFFWGGLLSFWIRLVTQVGLFEIMYVHSQRSAWLMLQESRQNIYWISLSPIRLNQIPSHSRVRGFGTRLWAPSRIWQAETFQNKNSILCVTVLNIYLNMKLHMYMKFRLEKKMLTLWLRFYFATWSLGLRIHASYILRNISIAGASGAWWARSKINADFRDFQNGKDRRSKQMRSNFRGWTWNFHSALSIFFPTAAISFNSFKGKIRSLLVFLIV